MTMPEYNYVDYLSLTSIPNTNSSRGYFNSCTRGKEHMCYIHIKSFIHLISIRKYEQLELLSSYNIHFSIVGSDILVCDRE